MYPPDSVVHLLKPGQVLTNYQVSVQWWVLKLFLQNKPAFSGHVPLSHHQSPSLSSLPLPSVPACTLIIVTCKWQRVMHEPETCMTLDSQSFFRLYWWANWRAKGVVLIITFFCIIYRSFWLSMLVPSFFTCSCTHVLLLSTVQQQQANLMLLLQRTKKVMSVSLQLVDFAIGLVNSVLTCPTGKWCFIRNLNKRRTLKSFLLVKTFLGLVEMTSGLVNASFSLPKWQAVKKILFAPCVVQ